MTDFSKMTDAQILAEARKRGAVALPPLPASAQNNSAGYHRPPPSSLSNERLLEEINNRRQNMGAIEDSARSYVTGLEKSGTGTLGLPHMVSDLINGAQDLGVRGGAFLAGHPQPTAQDLAGMHHTGVRPSDVVGAPLPQAVAAVLGASPSTHELDERMQAAGGSYHAPQTGFGRTAETFGQLTPAAAMPGGLLERLLRVSVPALTSSAAGEATHGTPLEPYARTGGAILGGGAEALGESAFNRPFSAFGEAAGDLTPQQIQQATDLRSKASGMGINLTVPEAVQQVTNGATGLGRVQRFVESTRRTAPGMADYFADRPQQVRQAAMSLADAVSPGSVGQAPGMISLDAQRAAEGAQMGANSARSQIINPAYTAAGSQDVDPQGLADILSNIKVQVAGDKTGLLGNRLQQFGGNLTDAAGAPITDIDNLSRVRNFWRDQIDIPPVGADPLSKEQAGAIGGHLKDLETLLKANPDYARGQALYANASRNIVDPLNAGPVGGIAETADLGAQTSALYPQNPPVGAPAETAQAIDALTQQNPEIAAALTRQHLANTLNQSTRDLTSGHNQFGGAIYAKNLLGNPEQAATLHSGLNAIDPTGKLSSDLSDLADALQATGRRERAGSMTAFNQEDQKALGSAPTAIKSFGALIDPLEWGQHVVNAVGKGSYNRNLDLLAAMMRDPDTQTVLQQALRLNGPQTSAFTTTAYPGAQLAIQQQASQ